MDDFYVKSLEAGAQPDSFGNITHTPASMATMQMNEQNKQGGSIWWSSSLMNPSYIEEQNRKNSFWRNLLNDF